MNPISALAKGTVIIVWWKLAGVFWGQLQYLGVKSA